MTETGIIDGKAFAEKLCQKIAAEVASLRPHGTPGLAVILVGEDPASTVYVRNKGRQTVTVGMNSFEHRLPASLSEDELIALIGQLNRDDSIHGILVQLPLPPQISADKVLATIDPAKDVDGFHIVNAGRLATGCLIAGFGVLTVAEAGWAHAIGVTMLLAAIALGLAAAAPRLLEESES